MVPWRDEIEKLIVNQIAQHGRRNEQLVSAQKSVAGKMNKRQGMPPECHLGKHQSDLGGLFCGGLDQSRMVGLRRPAAYYLQWQHGSASARQG